MALANKSVEDNEGHTALYYATRKSDTVDWIEDRPPEFLKRLGIVLKRIL
jgi:hypothetical protein